MSRRGRHSRRVGAARATIDMNSLIDLTFLLLVTFMLTISQLQKKEKHEQSNVSINLPEAKKEEQQKEEKNKLCRVTIDRKSKIYIRYLGDDDDGGEDAETTMDGLKDTLRELVAIDPEVAVLVRGDKDVKYDEIMKVVNAVRECRVQRMSLITVEK